MPRPRSVLVVDIGGSHVKMLVAGAQMPRRFESSAALTPDDLVRDVLARTTDWEYDAVAVGYPGSVDREGPVEEPGNLGSGWIRFDFESAFRRPVRVVNDAVMQALGGYAGGRMLFLGLGTGVGSALVSERVVVPLELGGLPYGPDRTLVDELGRAAVERVGLERWNRTLSLVTPRLRDAFAADYVMLGGGNAERVSPLPPHTRRGGNDAAFAGGFRLWDEIVEPHDQPPAAVWRVIR